MSKTPMAPRRTSVLIDAYNLDLPQGTGVATYARNLSYCLKALDYEVNILHGRQLAHNVDPLLREITFFDGGVPIASWRQKLKVAQELLTMPFDYHSTATRVNLKDQVIAPEQRRRMAQHDALWNVPDVYARAHRQFTNARSFHKVRLPQPLDLVHWTYPLPIRVEGALNIYTLHDLVPLRLPYTTLDRKRRYLRLMRNIVKTADHIVTVSECSRRDIIDLLGVAPERVTNTYQSVTLPEKLLAKPQAVAEQEVMSTFRLPPQGYFLFVGAIEPKKNIGRLIEAYLASGSTAPLVLAGPRAWKADEELRLYLSQERRLRNRIRVLDYMPLPLLVSLIRSARALVFPSVYEGFGLPVIEAMLLGTPVLSATTGSIPELAGDAALLVDPYDSQALAEAIRGLDGNDALRSELSARGTRRAAYFAPERYAERVGALYSRLLSPP
ncbi:MAG: glycosyltransferase family 1 protein [Pseudomonadota bacterium]